MHLQHKIRKSPLTVHSAHYHETLVTSHIDRQKSDLVQKLSLGNQNTKIKIKWKNLCFFVLTSSYSEGSRPQPAVSCKWGRKSPMVEEHRDVM